MSPLFVALLVAQPAQAPIHLKAGQLYLQRGQKQDAAVQLRLGLKLDGLTPALRCELLTVLEQAAAPTDVELRELNACRAPATPVAAPAPLAAELPPLDVCAGLPAAAELRCVQGDFRGACGLAPQHATACALAFAAGAAPLDAAAAVAALARAIEPVDGAGAQRVRAGLRLLEAGQPHAGAAALIEELARLGGPVAPLAQGLLQRLTGVALEAQARAALAAGHPLEAFVAASDAVALAPPAADEPTLKALLVAERERALRGRAARAEKAGEPLAALGFWLALEQLTKSADAAKHVARLSRAVHDDTQLELAVATASAPGWPHGDAVERQFRDELKRALPDARWASARDTAPWGVTFALEGPTLDVQAATAQEPVTVAHAFEVEEPNPAWEEAANAYNDAIHELDSARQSYSILQQGAQQMAAQAGGGVMGMVAGGLAAAELATALGLVAGAAGTLRKAKDTLAKTPRTAKRWEQGQTAAHALTLTATATATLTATIVGAQGVSVPRQVQATATAQTRQVEGLEAAGLKPEKPNLGALGALWPDVKPHVASLARDAALQLRAREAEQRWKDALAVDPKDAWALAAAWARYLAVADDAAKRREALNRLTWGLP